MISVQVDPKSMAALWDLQQRNTQALKAITPGESGYDDLIADATLKLRDAAVQEAPRLTGSLKSAHRGILAAAGTGQVFVDPAVRNPIYGGQPSVYGQIVHQRKPWLARTLHLHGTRILSEVGVKLFRRLDDIYKGAV